MGSIQRRRPSAGALRPHRAGVVSILSLSAGLAAAAGDLMQPGGVEVLDGAEFAKHVCHGVDQEFGACPPEEPCKPCVPQDCEFAEWGSWYDGGGCVGLRFRQREVKIAANECGKPCNGSKVESKPHLKSDCVAQLTDCAFDAWSAWSACTTPMDQAIRTRSIRHAPSVGGQGCVGNLKETRPCGGPQRHDCRFAAWREWTQCSASCGPGRKSRMRRIATQATHGGETCNDLLMEARTCMVEPCEMRDCALSEWSAWTSCQANPHGQRTRHRQVLVTPLGEGLPCDKDLMQTLRCKVAEPVNCSVSDWSAWSVCSKSCMGGQTVRERVLATPNEHGGDCPHTTLKELGVCNEGPCEKQQDCRLSEWDAWSACSATVGKGAKSRSRSVATPATSTGAGCSGPLLEVAQCVETPETVSDCRWGNWSMWSACTEACGGGTRSRVRGIESAAEHGGKACEAKVAREVEKCNTRSCDPGCVDGEWAAWGDWSTCTATCGTGFRTRSRKIAVEASHCGQPASGPQEDYAMCDLPPCEVTRDCALSPWGEWSNCSADCFGVRERSRNITEFSSGGGATCMAQALKVVQPCNPGLDGVAPAKCGFQPPQDCVVGSWSEWSQCTKTCGGGQHVRLRGVHQAARHGGLPCDEDLAVTRPCATQPCQKEVCQDCAWGDWAAWSECVSCGGQRSRRRSIKTLPNHCGKPCDGGMAKEIDACTSACEKDVFCAWSAWSAADCAGGCGMHTATRRRDLRAVESPTGALFKANRATDCQGSQVTVTPCEVKSLCNAGCVPQHCAFADWSEWSNASSTSCMGLCERQRIIKTMNNECGQPCDGRLVDTRTCGNKCDESRDCVVTAWTAWTPCDEKSQGQTYRSRKVLQEPKLDGTACPKHLDETRACNVPPPEPCRFQAWSEWTSCSKTCGKGMKMRDRGVLSTAAEGGEQCHGSLRQLDVCSVKACVVEPVVNCALGDWGAWSAVCNGDGQRERTREVVRKASGGGTGCDGSLKDTETCGSRAVDCQVSDWTSWDDCSRTCGSGQTRREREIHRFPEHGGALCPSELIQSKGCNDKPCEVRDCLVSSWATWSQCSATCGRGMQSRYRDIVRNRGEGGAGCFFELGETRECANSPACKIADCKITEWLDWSECSAKCGGGTRERVRKVDTMPDVSGQACPATTMREVEPCGMEACRKECIDGHFGPWSAWAPCSATCGGGTTFRMRKIALMANDCGKEPDGEDREEKFCNLDVHCSPPKDCAFGVWTTWSECSATCNGVKRRARTISEHGRGGGAFCTGALRETVPCHPSEGHAISQECMPEPDVDCVLSDWEPWSACSATCGGGEHMRSRSIVQHPVNNGKACNQSLSEVRECARTSCGGPNAVDCSFGDWQEWGECSKCDGERKRRRSILAYASHGGAPCRAFDGEEVQSCPRVCGERMYCSWTAWGAWSSCSLQCGTGGKRYRRRALALTSEEPNSTLPFVAEDFPGTGAQTGATIRRYDLLYRETKALEDYHLSEVAVAFFGGSCVALLGMAFVRGAGVTGGRRLGTPAATYRSIAGPRTSGRSAQIAAPCPETPRMQERALSRVPLVSAEDSPTGAE